MVDRIGVQLRLELPCSILGRSETLTFHHAPQWSTGTAEIDRSEKCRFDSWMMNFFYRQKDMVSSVEARGRAAKKSVLDDRQRDRGSADPIHDVKVAGRVPWGVMVQYCEAMDFSRGKA